MEWILMLQPSAKIVSMLSLTATIALAFFYGVFNNMALDEEESQTAISYKSGARIAKRWLIGSSILFFVSLPIGQSWNAFKRVIMYRAVVSKTTEKAVNTLEILLDRFGAEIEKYDAKEIMAETKEEMK